MSTMHVTLELDEEILQRAITELELTNPPAIKLNGSGAKTETAGGKMTWRGLYDPASHTITVASGLAALSKERLIEMVPHLRFTLLHELRHAWQRENWSAAEIAAAFSGPYHLQPGEIDANAWADYAMPAYVGIVKAKRRPVGGRTGFQKLGASR